MLCAFCNDFLLNALGYQCEDCRYTCHKKCYEKVVTKCISKSNTGVRIFILKSSPTEPLYDVQEGDEEKINHRIPHRFEPLTNIGANWCCHCGYMLPLGRKNARKCSECHITCHANCAHLVPDFCGMSMETANELLRNWRDINRARGDKVQFKPTIRQYSEYQIAPPLDSTLPGMDRMKISGPVPAPPVPPADPFARSPSLPPNDRFQSDPRFYQPQPQAPTYGQPPPVNRPPPGARVPVPPGYSQDPIMQGQIPLQDPSAAIPAVVDNGYGPSGYQVICQYYY